MNKLSKVIIGFLICIIIILAVIIIELIVTKNNKCGIKSKNSVKNDISQYVGVYLYTSSTNDYNNKSIQLNEDLTCKYLYDYNTCKWKISDKTITFDVGSYKIVFDSATFKDNVATYSLGSISDPSKTLKECENKITKYSETYEMINPSCKFEKEDNPITATVVNGGLLINNHIYYKVG